MRLVALALPLALWLGTTPGAAFVWPNTAEHVEEQLTRGDPATRRQAALRILELPARTAERLALKAMNDADIEVRLTAAHAAAELRLQPAADKAVGWLNDPEKRVRLAAAELLRAVPWERGVQPLGRLLGDPDAGVRRAAAAALGASRSADATLPLLGHLDDSTPEVRQAVALALAELGDRRAVVPLIGKIQDPRPSVRASVARALGELGDVRASSALLLLLRDEDEGVRVAALWALGRLGDVASVPALINVLKVDTRATVHTAALEALARLPADAAQDAIIAELGGDPAQATSARAAVVRIGERAVPALIRCISGQPRPALADGCVTTLGAVGDPRAAAPIRAALQRGAVPLRAGLLALGKLGDPESLPTALEHLAHADSAVRSAARRAAFEQLDPARPDGRAVDPVARALRGSRADKQERIELLALLGRSGSPRAMPFLLPYATASDDVRVRVAAIEALGMLGPNGQDKPLLQALDDDRPSIRLAAALALRRSAAGGTSQALIDRLSRHAEQDRVAIVNALAGALSRTRDPAVLARVEQLMLESRGAARDALIEALGRAPAAAGSAPLVRLSRRSPDVADRAKVAEALASHAEALPELTRLTTDADGSVRANAAWSLGAVGSSRELAVLSALRRDRDVAVAANAVAALGRIARREQSLPFTEICAALDDSRSYVRAAALGALRVAGRRCSGRDEARLLLDDPAELVRRAAATLLRNVPSRDAERARTERAQLERCAAEDPSGGVAGACTRRASALPSTTTPVLVYVVPQGEPAPVPLAPYTLVRADGLMRLGVTDRRGAVFEDAAPRGDVSLEVAAPLAR